MIIAILLDSEEPDPTDLRVLLDAGSDPDPDIRRQVMELIGIVHAGVVLGQPAHAFSRGVVEHHFGVQGGKRLREGASALEAKDLLDIERLHIQFEAVRRVV